MFSAVVSILPLTMIIPLPSHAMGQRGALYR